MMLKKRHAKMLMTTVAQLCWLSFALADDAAWVRIVPNETDKVLANPGMGWETFHRAADKDKNFPGELELFTERFFKGPADLPPGEIVDVADSISLPNDMSPGTYTLSLAVVGTEDTEPVLQLGIAGRSKDGWYPLSRVTVTRREKGL